MIVVDTNILAYFYIKGEHSSMVEKLLQLEPHWVAPILWRSEFRNVLALYIRHGKLDVSQAIWLMESAIKQMEGNEFDVPSYTVLTLVTESSCSAYDCEFVALAQMLSTVLMTTDKRILRSFPDWALHPRDFVGR
jgi:predicted nucleic acid-binding protein